jgi:membrane protease YdiL (CAAX protease family)
LNPTRSGLTPAVCTLILAALLWFVTFRVNWGVFWFKISFSAGTLGLLSLWLDPIRNQPLRLNPTSVAFGLLSAAVLYGIFWLGKRASSAIFPFAESQIGAIYEKGEGTPLWLIALLLFFVTGPSEELYWRGYLQRNLASRFGGPLGWLLATAAYAGVHICSANIMLIGAAAVAGAFWGLLYLRMGDLRPVIVSHAAWSAFIFAAFPIP